MGINSLIIFASVKFLSKNYFNLISYLLYITVAWIRKVSEKITLNILVNFFLTNTDCYCMCYIFTYFIYEPAVKQGLCPVIAKGNYPRRLVTVFIIRYSDCSHVNIRADDVRCVAVINALLLTTPIFAHVQIKQYYTVTKHYNNAAVALFSFVRLNNRFRQYFLWVDTRFKRIVIRVESGESVYIFIEFNSELDRYSSQCWYKPLTIIRVS